MSRKRKSLKLKPSMSLTMIITALVDQTIRDGVDNPELVKRNILLDLKARGSTFNFLGRMAPSAELLCQARSSGLVVKTENDGQIEIEDAGDRLLGRLD